MAFYRRAIQEFGEPALDVGCGTGRLLLPYLSEGLDVDGLDVSPEMLRICRTKADPMGLQPRLYQQPMEAMALRRRYGTILVPSSSFQLITDRSLAVRAMQRLHDHLRPGGALVMPFMVLGPVSAEPSQSEAHRPDGALVRRRSIVRYDPVTQLEDTEDTYEVIIQDQVVASDRYVRSPATREYSVNQARALYEDAGLRVARVLSGFSDRPWSAGDRLFTVVGIRPADSLLT
jgi:SAM-dependent methyltransferase